MVTKRGAIILFHLIKNNLTQYVKEFYLYILDFIVDIYDFIKYSFKFLWDSGNKLR